MFKMFLNIQSLFSALFYLILIGFVYKSVINLMNEPTAYEEKVLQNNAILPSFTLCPMPEKPLNQNYSIKNFEDVLEAIENAKLAYESTLMSVKSFEPM